jgi:hypothetical protein
MVQLVWPSQSSVGSLLTAADLARGLTDLTKFEF